MSKKHKCSWWGSNQVPLVYECETLVNDLFFTYISMKSQKLLGKCLENIITLPPGQNSQVGPASQDAFLMVHLVYMVFAANCGLREELESSEGSFPY